MSSQMKLKSRKHDSNLVKEKQFSCESCNATFLRRDRLIHHLKRHHADLFCTSVESNDSLSYKCYHCNQIFPHIEDIRLHAATQSCLKKYVCDVCGKKFQKLCTLIQHKKYHSNDSALTCNVCHKIFVNKFVLKCHKIIHLGLKPFKCELCKKDFRTKTELTSHRLIHSRRKYLICGICKRRITIRSLEEHIKRHWTGELKCEICAKQCIDSKYWKDHLLLHCGVKPHNCKICDESFASKRNLAIHLENHTPFNIHQALNTSAESITQPFFYCDTCNAGFPTMSRLEKHKKTHLKKFSCSECKKFFKSMHLLKKHEINHKLTDSSKKTDVEQIHNTLVTVIPKLELKFTDDEADSKDSFTEIKVDVELKYFDELETSEILIEKKEMISPKELQKSENETALSDTVDELETSAPEESKDKKLIDMEDKSVLSNIITSETGLEETFNLIYMASELETNKFHCQICNIIYAQKYSLTKHLKKHHIEFYSRILSKKKAFDLENRQYRCETCHITYKRKANLTKHNIKHHNSISNQTDLEKASYTVREKQFSCETCNTSYSRKDILLAHLKKIHTYMFYRSVESNETLSYKCYLCNQTFSQKDDLIKHAAEQSCFKKYVCDICGKKFGRQWHFLEHMKYHSKDNAYKCNICQKIFVRKDVLKSHKIIHLGLKPYKCEVCNKDFRTKTHLNKHSLIHSRRQFFKCGICNKKTQANYSLEVHIKTHWTGELDCKICSKHCVDRNFWEDHLLVHSGVKPLKCNICEEGFASKRNLKRHTENHKPFDIALASIESVTQPSVSLYFCDHCNASYSTRHYLQIHVKTHIKRRTNCSTCNKFFKKTAHLKKHELTHTLIKNEYKCGCCAILVTSKKSFDDHINLHLNQNPLICETSQKQFSEINSFKNHILFHSESVPHNRKVRENAKEYKCQCCPKLFTSRESFNEHVNLHLKEETLRCSTSQKKFNEIKSFKDHILVHSGYGTLKCPKCEEQFVFQAVLKQHLKDHKDFHCALCPSKYRTKSCLSKHIGKEHKEIEVFVTIYSCPECKMMFKNSSALSRHSKLHSDVDLGLRKEFVNAESIEASNLTIKDEDDVLDEESTIADAVEEELQEDVHQPVTMFDNVFIKEEDI